MEDQLGCKVGDDDDCVVETASLSKLISEYVDKWERTRPPYAGGRQMPGGGVSMSFVSPFAALAQETKMKPIARPIPEQAISRLIGRPDYPNGPPPEPPPETIGLGVAEALVAAMGNPEVLYDGTLEARPRNGAGAASCCGGSSVSFAPWSLTG